MASFSTLDDRALDALLAGEPTADVALAPVARVAAALRRRAAAEIVPPMSPALRAQLAQPPVIPLTARQAGRGALLKAGAVAAAAALAVVGLGVGASQNRLPTALQDVVSSTAELVGIDVPRTDERPRATGQDADDDGGRSGTAPHGEGEGQDQDGTQGQGGTTGGATPADPGAPGDRTPADPATPPEHSNGTPGVDNPNAGGNGGGNDGAPAQPERPAPAARPESPAGPPAAEAPAVEPPATEPPAADPPTTEAPAVDPPATEPTATEPTATEPEPAAFTPPEPLVEEPVDEAGRQRPRVATDHGGGTAGGRGNPSEMGAAQGTGAISAERGQTTAAAAGPGNELGSLRDPKP